jgi:hypothetical protein
MSVNEVKDQLRHSHHSHFRLHGKDGEWREEFDRLEKANNELGNEKTNQHVN